MARRRGSRSHNRPHPTGGARRAPQTRSVDSAGRAFLPGPGGQPIVVPCAICGHGGRGVTRVRFLPHGLHVWLCAVHGRLAFLLRDGGREFARRLHGRWLSNGEYGPRRRLALMAHLERIRQLAGASDKPGSHSWPKLRQEAERRFAAGDDPATVIRELRLEVSGGPAVAPSLRTFRRWFAEGRWLLPPPPPQPAAPTAATGPPAPPEPPTSDHPHRQRE